MDAIDRKIAAALQRRPELTVADLAEEVGMSQTPCWRRLKRLQDSGAVLKRAWIFDAKSFDLAINVFAELRLRQHDEQTLEAFESAIRNRPEIVECFSMSGESDYLLRVAVSSVATYEVLLKKVLLHLPGVGSINSRFALNAIKITTDLPI